MINDFDSITIETCIFPRGNLKQCYGFSIFKTIFFFWSKILELLFKKKKRSKCIKFKLTESTSRSSKSWEKSIPRFGLGIVDQFEWWLVFVMEIRVLIVCLRSKLRLVLIDIFSVRICCAGPVRNLDFHESLRIKHFSGFYLSQTIWFWKRLIWHVLEFFWELTWSPASWIILDYRWNEFGHNRYELRSE